MSLRNQHDRKTQTARMVNLSNRSATRARLQPLPRSQSNSTCSSNGPAIGGRTQETPAPSASPVATEAPSIFAHWADVYRRRGYWPRPITLGTKACHVREWQKPDSELSEATLASWLTSHAHFGIGLLMGSPFPDGTTLGALDIDHDEYVRLGRASLIDAPSGRIGKKGAVFFVRVRGSPQQSRVHGSRRSRQASTARSPSAYSSGSSASSRRRSTPIPGSLTAGLGGPCTRSTSMNCRSWRWTMTNEQSAVSIGLIREVFSSEFTPQLFTGVANTRAGASTRRAARAAHRGRRPDPGDRRRSAARELFRRYASRTARNDRRRAKRKGFDKEPAGQRRRLSPIDMLNALFAQQGVELFHSDLLTAYVGIPTSAGGVINAPIGSARSNHFVQEVYYRATRKALKERDLDDFNGHLRALATFEGQRHVVYVRVGGSASDVYHDLGRDDGAVVKVTADGYTITHEPAVKLIRMSGMKALPLPRGGRVAAFGPDEVQKTAAAR